MATSKLSGSSSFHQKRGIVVVVSCNSSNQVSSSTSLRKDGGISCRHISVNRQGISVALATFHRRVRVSGGLLQRLLIIVEDGLDLILRSHLLNHGIILGLSSKLSDGEGARNTLARVFKRVVVK